MCLGARSRACHRWRRWKALIIEATSHEVTRNRHKNIIEISMRSIQDIKQIISATWCLIFTLSSVILPFSPATSHPLGLGPLASLTYSVNCNRNGKTTSWTTQIKLEKINFTNGPKIKCPRCATCQIVTSCRAASSIDYLVSKRFSLGMSSLARLTSLKSFLVAKNSCSKMILSEMPPVFASMKNLKPLMKSKTSKLKNSQRRSRGQSWWAWVRRDKPSSTTTTPY